MSKSPDVAIVIPARMDSKRFPGKPLMKLGSGETLLDTVYRSALMVPNTRVFATSPDEEIIERSKNSFTVRVIRTGDAQSGSQRCAQALTEYENSTGTRHKIWINWQCDEPFVRPTDVTYLIQKMWEWNWGYQSRPTIGTIVAPLEHRDLYNTNVVKTAVGNNGRCCWFSRHPISKEFGHVGIYAFPDSLRNIILKTVPSEHSLEECLEQLTWIESLSIPIRAIQIPALPKSINSPEDLHA